MEPSEKPGAAIAENARAWVRCLASGAVEAADLDALEAWLASDPAHARAFERERGFWRDLEQHRALFAEAAPIQSRDNARAARWRPAAGRVLLPALAASLVLAVMGPSLLLHLRADHVTGAGEVRAVDLPDR